MGEGQSQEEVRRLLTGALQAWHLEGMVEAGKASTFQVNLGDVRVTVQRLPETGWTVEAAGRLTRHAGIPGMLGTVHAALDPDYRPTRFRVAPAPAVPEA